MKPVPRLLLALATACALLSCAAPAQADFDYRIPPEPEAASGFTAKPGWATTKFAVAAANPLATDAGYQVLRAGGTAIDAAIAVQMVLGLVEPQSSGIGGGLFLLHYDGHAVEAYDGRETAPAAADEKLFLNPDGTPMAFNDAVVGGRSVGVPGTLRALELAHREHGRLPWATLFEPAIRLAEQGFKVSPRLATLAKANRFLKDDPVAASYFLDANGEPHPAGYLLRNPEYAAVLRRIAREGADAFYKGEIAQAIVEKVRHHPRNPGAMTLADLASYQAKKRAPICYDYSARGRDYRICGFPPPSSGPIAIGQMLRILHDVHAESKPLESGLPSADWLHLYTEAARLAFADRNQYVGDPDFVQPPAGAWTSLLDPAYLASRARLIGPKSMKVAQPGTPGRVTSRYAPATDTPEHGTSHISIVDAQGNAVAMTTTIEQEFGSRQMVHGFMLNNELTDFNFAPRDTEGRPVANRVEAGKRPRSSMAPTLVFDKASGQFVLSAGSPGGAGIIHFTAKTLWAILDWGLDAQRAIDLPNFGSYNGPTVLEQNRFPRSTIEALKTRGAEVREQDMTSGLQAVQKTPTGYFGGADPRREGIVMGE
ncbi:MAG TPA: gamma-glutamyltransferase [Ramlibacter sp.]|uniref:gamma-glutamyltransferase n=1 Tax=Ramlibacter sp. TaxID=1917967 RepID=UPI002B7A4B3A|nr:gamma-glutamyltransferase [Ramlibacter sp.]HVZ44440.1 gamma-glutamyltransferase [Ramlibacter sp.]